MRQNFKLLCCAAYILNLIVSICLSCWPNLWCSGVFSTKFRSFRKNSAEPDISRKYGSASRIFFKNPAEGSICRAVSALGTSTNLSEYHQVPILYKRMNNFISTFVC